MLTELEKNLGRISHTPKFPLTYTMKLVSSSTTLLLHKKNFSYTSQKCNMQIVECTEQMEKLKYLDSELSKVSTRTYKIIYFPSEFVTCLSPNGRDESHITELRS